jgi:hypothetical protein
VGGVVCELQGVAYVVVLYTRPARYDVTSPKEWRLAPVGFKLDPLTVAESLLAAVQAPPMDAFLDILYTTAPIAPHPLQTFDLFVPPHSDGSSEERAPLICFVHGGAWRS